MESDADYRQRIPAAFEGMSVAGPVGAYEYHALSWMVGWRGRVGIQPVTGGSGGDYSGPRR